MTRYPFLILVVFSLLTACSNKGMLATTTRSVEPSQPTATTDVAQQPTATADATDNSEVLSAIATNQVVYLAETHNSEADHAAQLEIIQALDAQNDLAIGLEMFQRPFQSALDGYLAGTLSETELIKQSEYETRWGYDWALYAPILRYAKENQIPLIALNTPTEVTRQVAIEGLQSLSGNELANIPPIEEIDTTDEAYKESISAVFNAHGGAGHSMNFDNFFAAQVLWDETMADAVVNQLETEPEKQVIVLAGEGHIAYDYGIPNRVERRMPEVEQSSVRLIAANSEVDPEFADFSWLTPE